MKIVHLCYIHGLMVIHILQINFQEYGEIQEKLQDGIFGWIGETYTSFFGSDEDKEKKEQKDSGATKFPGMIDIEIGRAHV